MDDLKIENKYNCLSCIRQLEKGQIIRFSSFNHRNTLVMPTLNIRVLIHGQRTIHQNERYLLDKDSENQLTQFLCALLNNQKGHLFIGIEQIINKSECLSESKNYSVKGVQANFSIKQYIQKKIEQIFLYYLQGEKGSDYFKVDFIPMMNYKNENIKNLFVIRVYICGPLKKPSYEIEKNKVNQAKIQIIHMHVMKRYIDEFLVHKLAVESIILFQTYGEQQQVHKFTKYLICYLGQKNKRNNFEKIDNLLLKLWKKEQCQSVDNLCNFLLRALNYVDIMNAYSRISQLEKPINSKKKMKYLRCAREFFDNVSNEVLQIKLQPAKIDVKIELINNLLLSSTNNKVTLTHICKEMRSLFIQMLKHLKFKDFKKYLLIKRRFQFVNVQKVDQQMIFNVGAKVIHLIQKQKVKKPQILQDLIKIFNQVKKSCHNCTRRLQPSEIYNYLHQNYRQINLLKQQFGEKEKYVSQRGQKITPHDLRIKYQKPMQFSSQKPFSLFVINLPSSQLQDIEKLINLSGDNIKFSKLMTFIPQKEIYQLQHTKGGFCSEKIGSFKAQCLQVRLESAGLFKDQTT